MDDIRVFLFVVPLLVYTLWFVFSLERFRSRNAKRRGIIRGELRKIRIQVTIISFTLPLLAFGLMWIVSSLLGEELPKPNFMRSSVIICSGSLWLFSMFVLWSFTAGWRIIDSEKNDK